MKRISLILLLILGFATLSFAGRIYGGITEGGKAVAKGVKVDVTCAGKTYSAETDANGAFSMMVPEQGKCALKVTYQGQTRYGRKGNRGRLSGRDPAVLPVCVQP